MNKFPFLKIILFFGGCSLFSYQNCHSQILFGIKGGLNSSWVSVIDTRNIDYTKPENALGMNFGAVLDIGLNRFLSIKTELSYSEKGYKIRRYYDQTHLDNLDITSSDYWQFTSRYIEIPALLKYFEEGRRLKFFVNAGPYVGYWFGGNFSGSYLINNLGGPTLQRKDVSESYTFDNQYGTNHSIDNRFDFGAALGAGLSYKLKKGEIFVEGRYNHGFIDLKKFNIIPTNYTGEFNRNWSVSIGYLRTIKPIKKRREKEEAKDNEETNED